MADGQSSAGRAQGKPPWTHSKPGQPQGAPTQDVVLGDLHAVELEGAHRLPQQNHPRDDRGSAVGMQTDDLAALGFGHVGKTGEQQLDGGEQ